MSSVDELQEIEKLLGQVVIVLIEGKKTLVKLVDGEQHFNQLGMSAGFVHFADPDYEEICLGFAGVSTVYNMINGIKI